MIQAISTRNWQGALDEGEAEVTSLVEVLSERYKKDLDTRVEIVRVLGGRGDRLHDYTSRQPAKDQTLMESAI